MDDRTIWALTNEKSSLVLGDAPSNGTNGLLFEHDQLLILRLRMGPATMPLTIVASGIDGIVALGNKQLLVTKWNGKIWYVRADGTTELKMDTSKAKINSADMGYNSATKIIFVPTFFHNPIKTYLLN